MYGGRINEVTHKSIFETVKIKSWRGINTFAFIWSQRKSPSRSSDSQWAFKRMCRGSIGWDWYAFSRWVQWYVSRGVGELMLKEWAVSGRKRGWKLNWRVNFRCYWYVKTLSLDGNWCAQTIEEAIVVSWKPKLVWGRWYQRKCISLRGWGCLGWIMLSMWVSRHTKAVYYGWSTYVTISVIVPYTASSCLLLPPPPTCPFNGSDSEGGVFTYLYRTFVLLLLSWLYIRTGWHKYIIILARKGVSGSGGIDRRNGRHQSINQGTLLSTPNWSVGV